MQSYNFYTKNPNPRRKTCPKNQCPLVASIAKGVLSDRKTGLIFYSFGLS